MEHCKLFVDTNVDLHYRPLPELNLPQLTNAKQVTVILPRITLRELDKHKSTHSSRKIKDRAGKVLAELELAVTEGTPLGGKIGVEFFQADLTDQLAAHGLDPHWHDEVMVAAALLVPKHAQAR